jgi:hypothetical protein
MCRFSGLIGVALPALPLQRAAATAAVAVPSITTPGDRPR